MQPQTRCGWQNNAMAGNTRAYAARSDIVAPLSRVWDALTQTSDVERWMSKGSRVVARAGGSFSGSLDRRFRFSAHIDVFDSHRRIRLVHLPPENVPRFEGAVIDDILIDVRDDKTILRVLGSNFPRAEEYGSFYMVRQLGWRQALARLKVYLENNMDKLPEKNP